MFIVEHSPRYLPDSNLYYSPFKYVISARSSDQEARIKRIDDVINLQATADPEYPFEVMIGFSNPAAGLDPYMIMDIFNLNVTTSRKFELFCQQISHLRPPNNYSLHQGETREGLVVSRKVNIETGQVTPPYVQLAPLHNKQKLTHAQLTTFIRSDLTDRNTRSHQETLRTALFLEQIRLNPYAQVYYDRQLEATIVNGAPVSWLEYIRSPAETIIRELTVNASACVAAFAYWNKIPVIYKGTQDNSSNYTPVYSTQPVLHRYYNVTAYLNVSRQLRSVIDKFNGLQLSGFLRNYQLSDIPLSQSHIEDLLEYMGYL